MKLLKFSVHEAPRWICRLNEATSDFEIVSIVISYQSLALVRLLLQKSVGADLYKPEVQIFTLTAATHVDTPHHQGRPSVLAHMLRIMTKHE